MSDEIVFCKGGGCTAKLGAGVLSRVLEKLPKGPMDENLLVGYDSRDDAAVYRISDDIAIVQTLDFFPPMVEDPYTFGQIERCLCDGWRGKDGAEYRVLSGADGSEYPWCNYAGRRGKSH